MPKSKGYKQVTEAEFKNIKLMQQAGLMPVQVHKITGRTAGTIASCMKFETLADYKAFHLARKNERLAREATPSPKPEPQPQEDFSLVLSGLDRIEARMASCELALNELLRHQTEQADHDKVSRWSLGRGK